ncbi:myristylated entry-fusion protein [Hypsugopox virus]|nr:myristylated entry-fusion protein [Hypsugopox virus]
MGGSISVPDYVKRPAPPPKPTSEMLLNVDKMYNIIGGLRQISDVLYIGKVSPEKLKILKHRFPEFTFTTSGPENLTFVIRSTFNNDIPICCKTFALTYYWLHETEKTISKDFKNDSILNSCDPDLHNSGKCDKILTEWCQTPNANKDVCNHWMGSAFNRISSQQYSLIELIRSLTKLCVEKGADKPICELWLHNLRARKTNTANSIIDMILKNQNQSFKDKYMKCSYPTEEKLKESLKYNEARECWDLDCANANINFLLTENYNNLGLCSISRCNASINNLTMDKTSSVRMSCGINNLLSLTPVNRFKVLTHNIEHSFKIKYHLITILSLLVIWLLIVAL